MDIHGRHGNETRTSRAFLATALVRRRDGFSKPAVTQTLMQFICGYHDADLRDATGLGHGRLIALHGTTPAREQSLPRLVAGEVPGIAIAEPIGVPTARLRSCGMPPSNYG